VANNPDWRAGSRQRIHRPLPISLGRLLALFVKVGSLGFGGGMAVIALMEREFVRKRKLVSAEEFLHGVGLGQMLGSFAINAAYLPGADDRHQQLQERRQRVEDLEHKRQRG